MSGRDLWAGRLRAWSLPLISLVGFGLSLYLLLHHWGFTGTLTCSLVDGCSIVQTSRFAVFLGVPVAGWGVAWYLTVLAAALWDVSDGVGPGARWALIGLAVSGVAFSTYLTAIEIFVLHALCQWCILSALLTVIILVLVRPWHLPGLRR